MLRKLNQNISDSRSLCHGSNPCEAEYTDAQWLKRDKEVSLMAAPFEIVTARSQQKFRRELFHDVPRLLAKFISSSCISSVAFSYHSIDLYRCPGGSFLRSLVCS